MREHYGTEPPSGESGWTYEGAGKWVKDDGDVSRMRAREDEPDGPRVAVIGGGPGGLFATYIINQRMPSARVTIFEASDRVGGKILTDEFSDGTPFEAGVAELYEYKGSDQRDPLRQLIEDDLGLETVDMSGGALILNGEVLRDLDEVEEMHGRDARQRIEAFHRKMAELMPLDKYANRWQPDNDHPWANKTFRECIERELTGPDGIDEVARRYVEASVHSDLATEPWTCNGLNGVKNVLMDNDEYMQLYHVRGGIGLIVEALQDKIMARVRTSTRATAVSKGDDGDESGDHDHRTDADSTYRVSLLHVSDDSLREMEQEFDAVVVAMPNHWLRMVRWEGKLAAAIHATCAHYDLPAHYLRVSMLFDEKWWAKLRIPGEFWMMDMLNGCCCYDESTRWGGGTAMSHDVSGQLRDDAGRWMKVDTTAKTLTEDELEAQYAPIGVGNIDVSGIKDKSIYIFDKLSATQKEEILNISTSRVVDFDRATSHYELRRVSLKNITPSQHGESRTNGSSRESARTIATGNLAKIAKADLAPVALNKSNTIIDGNHRYSAAEMNGQEHIYALVPRSSAALSANDEEMTGTNHVLSFLIAGGDALLMCSNNQNDECIVDYVLQNLPAVMRQDAEDHLVDARVERYVGSINAQPGGWPVEELRGEHVPDPEDHPGVFLVGDYFFDSTLNAALMSANVAVELLLEHFGKESEGTTPALDSLESKDVGV